MTFTCGFWSAGQVTVRLVFGSWSWLWKDPSTVSRLQLPESGRIHVALACRGQVHLDRTKDPEVEAALLELSVRTGDLFALSLRASLRPCHARSCRLCEWSVIAT